MELEPTITCSFCGTVRSGEEAKALMVAGPEAFICRDCVEMTITVFADEDAAWGEKIIAQIREQVDKA